jgi:hypothetical protein
MSDLGQSRRFDRRQITSGLPPEADIFGVGRYVSKVPNSDIRMLLLSRVLPADWYCDLKNGTSGV